jgi:hypothetical protein
VAVDQGGNRSEPPLKLRIGRSVRPSAVSEIGRLVGGADRAGHGRLSAVVGAGHGRLSGSRLSVVVSGFAPALVLESSHTAGT